MEFDAEAARQVGIGKELETYTKDVATNNQWDSYKDVVSIEP